MLDNHPRTASKRATTIWLAAKIEHAIADNPKGYGPAEIARLLGLPQRSGRQTVGAWKKSGRIDKKWLSPLAYLLRRPLRYFLEEHYPDHILSPDEDILTDAEMSPEEARIVLAFRDLSEDQQAKLLAEAEAKAAENRDIHKRLEERYSTMKSGNIALFSPRKKK